MLDLKVLIKRVSEGDRVPYRPIALNVLGRISPLKTTIRAPNTDESKKDDDEDPEGFTPVGSAKKKENYVDKETIYRNITSILDGFAIQDENQRRR